MKRKVKIDYQGSYYKVYCFDIEFNTWWGKNRGHWEYLDSFTTYEKAKEAADKILKFPEYLP